MKFSIYKLPYQYYWLILVILINVISTAYTLNTGLMMGDLKGREFAHDELLVLSCLLIVFTYVFFLGFIFQFVHKIKLRHFIPSVERESPIVGGRYNLLMAFLNILFIFFCLNNDANMSGHASEVSSPFKYFWIFFPPDIMFILSCAHYSRSKYFSVNLLTYALSSIIRGWSAIFLLMIFLGGYLLYQSRRLSLRVIVFAVSVVIALYPFLLAAKWAIRGGSDDVSFLVTFAATLSNSSYLDLWSLSLFQLVGRLELSGLLAHTIDNYQVLQSGFDTAQFVPFWYEGLLGNIYQVLFLGGRGLEMGTWVLGSELFSHSDRVVGHSVTNLSFLSWFVIAPYLSIFYFLYMLLLVFLCIYLNRLNGDSGLAKVLMWFFLFGALFPPWISSLIAMIWCCCVFMVLRFFLQKTHRVRIKKSVLSSNNQQME